MCCSVQVGIDDRELLTATLPKRRLNTNAKIYLGGVPDEYIIQTGNSATLLRMVGCVGDVTLNGQ